MVGPQALSFFCTHQSHFANSSHPWFLSLYVSWWIVRQVALPPWLLGLAVFWIRIISSLCASKESCTLSPTRRVLYCYWQLLLNGEGDVAKTVPQNSAQPAARDPRATLMNWGFYYCILSGLIASFIGLLKVLCQLPHIARAAEASLHHWKIYQWFLN